MEKDSVKPKLIIAILAVLVIALVVHQILMAIAIEEVSQTANAAYGIANDNEYELDDCEYKLRQLDSKVDDLETSIDSLECNID